MSSSVFKDRVFPKHISDLMGLMHMMVFDGTDGEEHWDTFSDRRTERVRRPGPGALLSMRALH